MLLTERLYPVILSARHRDIAINHSRDTHLHLKAERKNLGPSDKQADVDGLNCQENVPFCQA
jgi:hypothetical protein